MLSFLSTILKRKETPKILYKYISDEKLKYYFPKLTIAFPKLSLLNDTMEATIEDVLQQSKEHNYVNHKLHLYSRRLIDICLKHRAGNLFLVDQQEKEELAKSDEFLLRNWSFYSLRKKIIYKAKRVGINLIIE